MRHQTGEQQKCEYVPGKKQNCNEFGQYERPNTSASANLCNGGWFRGDWYDECPVQRECKAVTARSENGHRSLPVLHEPRPFGSSPFSSGPRPQVMAQTPNVREFLGKEWSGLPNSLLPTSIPTKQPGLNKRGPIEPHEVPYPLPYPIQPPGSYPATMQTPYAGPQSHMAGGVTPTFLPSRGEGVFDRLVKNVAQGMVGSTGWHIFDFARTVDMFGNRED